jgi:DNA-binding response OmpR family regulator
MKRLNKDKPLPVIILTARQEPEIIEQAQQLGADGFLKKPFQLDELLGLIRMQLPQMQAA